VWISLNILHLLCRISNNPGSLSKHRWSRIKLLISMLINLRRCQNWLHLLFQLIRTFLWVDVRNHYRLLLVIFNCNMLRMIWNCFLMLFRDVRIVNHFFHGCRFLQFFIFIRLLLNLCVLFLNMYKRLLLLLRDHWLLLFTLLIQLYDFVDFSRIFEPVHYSEHWVYKSLT
jgi:hypothetical protein